MKDKELIKKLKELGLSDDTIKAMVSTYDLGYAQGLIDSKQLNNEGDSHAKQQTSRSSTCTSSQG